MELTIALGLKSALKPEMARLNQNLEKLAKESDGFLGDLLRYVLIGSGKRIRPALVFLGAQLGPSNLDEVRVVEESVELIHIATLIHDDIVDQAALRRGRKTVVSAEGVDTAVLLGDHIFTVAFQKLARINQPQILGLMAQSTAVMCAGEIDQLKKRFQFDLSEDDYFDFIRKKTAALFGASAQSGALLGNQTMAVQLALDAYAVNLGIAFQITDDLLDLTGEESTVGKTLHTDLLNGKMTLPLIHYRNVLKSGVDKQHLISDLQNPNGHLNSLIQNLKNAGSLAYAQEAVDRHIRLALSQLNLLPDGETRIHLAGLADILKNRQT